MRPYKKAFSPHNDTTFH